MTKEEKRFIETLKNIKEYCSKQEGCDIVHNDGCVFRKFGPYDNYHCQFRNITNKLSLFPQYWHIEEIERLLKQ